MTNVILDKIQIKRGLKANLPVLDEGEPALCTDTRELAFGTASGNIFISAGAGAGTLVFNTLAELQAAYPGGTTQPAWIIGDNAWYYWSGAVVGDTTAPTLTITAGGTFTGTKTVTLSANETATIYYTLDGSAPTTASAVYSTPLSITTTKTLKAFAKDIAGNTSAIQTVVYTLDAAPGDTTPPANVTNLAISNQTATGLTLTWTAVSDAASYDVYNGATLLANVTSVNYNVTGLTASTQYTFTVKAKDAANNIASGASVTGSTTAPADTTAPVLTITPAATFADTQTVTMSANETATIYYTLDDTDPKTSGTKLTYTAPLTLTATDTIKAYARDTAGNESAVQTVTYTKDIPAAWVTSGLVRKWDNVVNRTTVTNDGSYYPATGDWTIAFTIQRKAYMDIFSQYTIGGTNNTVRISVNDSSEFITVNLFPSTGGNIELNSEWIMQDPAAFYHFALVRDSATGTTRIYANNVAGDGVGNVTLKANNTETIKIGLIEGGNTIKNLLYYNRALTTAELTQNYNALK